MLGPLIRTIRTFQSATLTNASARAFIERRLASRERVFLEILRDAVFARPGSLYERLFAHARADLSDVRASVEAHGVEGALAQLRDAGVYLSHEEFKDARRVERNGVEFEVHPGDLDNPLAKRHFHAPSVGSSGIARRSMFEPDLMTHEAACFRLHLDGNDLHGRPLAIWRGVPPVSSGLKRSFLYLKAGAGAPRWYAQNRHAMRPRAIRHILLTGSVVGASRLLGWRFPVPHYVHQDDAVRIARWLAVQTRAGRPAHVDTNTSSGVRLCLAAQANDLDISGTFFTFGGEPYTPAKEAVVKSSACSAVSTYAMSEASSLVAVACATPGQRDDMHVASTKLAVIQHEIAVRDSQRVVPSLLLTILHPGIGRLLINYECGDHGSLERRPCGCPLGRAGLEWHLANLRSHEKLTSEGMSYIGTDLVSLIEDVLPARFGGSPATYQLVEEEIEGMPKISLVVSPDLGAIDEVAMIETVYSTLARGSDGRLMSGFWHEAGTVRVVRRAPYATEAAKILPLHVKQDARG